MESEDEEELQRAVSQSRARAKAATITPTPIRRVSSGLPAGTALYRRKVISVEDDQSEEEEVKGPLLIVLDVSDTEAKRTEEVVEDRASQDGGAGNQRVRRKPVSVSDDEEEEEEESEGERANTSTRQPKEMPQQTDDHLQSAGESSSDSSEEEEWREEEEEEAEEEERPARGRGRDARSQGGTIIGMRIDDDEGNVRIFEVVTPTGKTRWLKETSLGKEEVDKYLSTRQTRRTRLHPTPATKGVERGWADESSEEEEKLWEQNDEEEDEGPYSTPRKRKKRLRCPPAPKKRQAIRNKPPSRDEEVHEPVATKKRQPGRKKGAARGRASREDEYEADEFVVPDDEEEEEEDEVDEEEDEEVDEEEEQQTVRRRGSRCLFKNGEQEGHGHDHDEVESEKDSEENGGEESEDERAVYRQMDFEREVEAGDASTLSAGFSSIDEAFTVYLELIARFVAEDTAFTECYLRDVKPRDVVRFAHARRRVEGELETSANIHATTAWDPEGIFKQELETYPFFEFKRIASWWQREKERCEICRRKSMLKWEVILHGRQYDAPATWSADRWLERGIRDKLEDLSHEFMDGDDEEQRVVREANGTCTFRAWRYHQVMHFKYFLARKVYKALRDQFGLDPVRHDIVNRQGAVAKMMDNEEFIDECLRYLHRVLRRGELQLGEAAADEALNGSIDVVSGDDTEDSD